MLGFIGKLLGSEKALEKSVEAVSNGLDKLVYTDEEKAEAIAKDRSEARKMVVGWMQATQGQNLARRVIALAITGTWITTYILAMILDTSAIWITDSDMSSKIIASSAIISDRAKEMNGAVMLILAFYFSAPYMGEIAQSVLGRKVDNKPKG